MFKFPSSDNQVTCYEPKPLDFDLYIKEREMNGRKVSSKSILKHFPCSTKFTPQSGINTKTNDLSYMLSVGLEVRNSNASLSLFPSGDPLRSARVMQGLAQDASNKCDKHLSNSNNEK